MVLSAFYGYKGTNATNGTWLIVKTLLWPAKACQVEAFQNRWAKSQHCHPFTLHGRWGFICTNQLWTPIHRPWGLWNQNTSNWHIRLKLYYKYPHFKRAGLTAVMRSYVHSRRYWGLKIKLALFVEHGPFNKHPFLISTLLFILIKIFSPVLISKSPLTSRTEGSVN